MSAQFDVYASALDDLQAHSVAHLDGIDGFFDQYFEGRRPGDTIQFLVLRGALAPRSASELETLPLVEGRLRRCSVTEGDVEVVSLTPFGKWLRLVDAPLVSKNEFEALCPEVTIDDLLSTATNDGITYWRSDADHWRNLSQTTAVLALFQLSDIRIAIVKTNAVPGMVVRLNRAA